MFYFFIFLSFYFLRKFINPSTPLRSPQGERLGIIILLCTAGIFLHAHQPTELLLKQAKTCTKNNNVSRAIELYKQCIVLDPKNKDAHYELGLLLHKQQEYLLAHKYLARALELKPHSIQKIFTLGTTLLSVGGIDEAITAFNTILKYNPHVISARYNNAFACKIAGNLDEAINIYKTIIAQKPNNESAHLGLAFSYLAKGDYKHGWHEHGWNLKRLGRYSTRLRSFLHNNTIEGKIILLRPEGGLGDTINFFRYTKQLKELGATVYATVQKPLVPLLSSHPYVDSLLTIGDPIPAHHAQATFMTLPAIFGSTEKTMAKNIPYIYPDKNLTKQWQETIQKDHNLKIGICWQSDIFNDSSRMPIARRGMPLKYIYQWNNIKNITFYSLQKKEGLEQLTQIPSDFRLLLFDGTFGTRHFNESLSDTILDFDEKHGAFMDTAAIMPHLDLIITVDSAIAHLAGALGKKVWLLLPYSTDWRWLAGRNYSPWYPTMRIFKQKKPFDWQYVADQVKKELAQL